ncbi:hypothetical protein VTL71DRAFT_4376 [Oculimacula yallundae]|uniref:Uncharacterized protein n=1 Tax=Oculimacula yallundae TaxID=86028 RepID=A0ABR4C2H1_9HELO
MQQLGMGFERNLNDPAEGRAGDDLQQSEDRCQQQVRALKEQLKALKEVIKVSGVTATDPLEITDRKSNTLEQQTSSRNLSELTSERDTYFNRVQDLERRVGGLLSLSPSGDDLELQNVIAQRDKAAADRVILSNEINREGGYLAQIRDLRIQIDSTATQAEAFPGPDSSDTDMNALKTERNRLRNENDAFRNRLNDISIEYQDMVTQRDFLQTQNIGLETQLDALVDSNISTEKPEDAEESEREERRQGAHTGHVTTGSSQPGQPESSNQDCEVRLKLVRAERDSAIQKIEEARKTLATRTAERNGAHQRMHILEAAAKESQIREEQHDAQILLSQATIRESRSKEEQLKTQLRQSEEQMQVNIQTANTDSEPNDFEQREIAFLQGELEHAVAAAAEAQHERDAARAEINALEIENVIANSAAETANDVVNELQQSLEAARNAALAEREKSEDARRMQNRLRVERETIRIEVARLEQELSAAHNVSAGLIRSGSNTVGDFVQLKKENDDALRRLSELQGDIVKAHAKARDIQLKLDDYRTRYANISPDEAALEELNRVTVQRDEALVRVEDLEQLLKGLEENYRKNLDQWERQTQRDEKEITAARDSLVEEKKTNKNLSSQLEVAKTELQAAATRLLAAETRAHTAEEFSEIADARCEALQIEILQMEQDLEHGNEDRDELEGLRDRLQAECLRLGGLILAARNEVARLGSYAIAPDGAVQADGERPTAPPREIDPSDIRRPSIAPLEPIPDDQNEEGFNPFPYPMYPVLPDLESSRHQSLSSDSSLSSLHGRASSDSFHSASSRRESNVSPGRLSPLESPFLPPSNTTQTQDSLAVPLLRTSPTMSTQIDPRCTRNPAPEYGASTRSRSRKRGTGPGSDEQEGPKRRRSDE